MATAPYLEFPYFKFERDASVSYFGCHPFPIKELMRSTQKHDRSTIESYKAI